MAVEIRCGIRCPVPSSRSLHNHYIFHNQNSKTVVRNLDVETAGYDLVDQTEDFLACSGSKKKKPKNNNFFPLTPDFQQSRTRHTGSVLLALPRLVLIFSVHRDWSPRNRDKSESSFCTVFRLSWKLEILPIDAVTADTLLRLHDNLTLSCPTAN